MTAGLRKFFRKIGLQVLQGLEKILLSLSIRLRTKDPLDGTPTNGREDTHSSHVFLAQCPLVCGTLIVVFLVI